MTSIVYYIDSHGFGHSTRSMALMECFPTDWKIILRTNAPGWLFKKELHRDFTRFPSPLDIHPHHRASYHIDPMKTLLAAEEKLARLNQIIEDEARWLESVGADAVVSDISPLAILASHTAGLPSFGVSNFTWDWIFEPFLSARPDSAAVARMREMMLKATLNFRLPFSSPNTFPNGARETPLLVRLPSQSREEARRHFGFREDARYALVTFGGIQGPVDSLKKLESFAPLQFVQVDNCADTTKSPNSLSPHPEAGNLWRLHQDHLYHPDLVLAVDAVFTKPGYGIISECAATATPLLLDERNDFREFEVVREALRDFPQVFILKNEQTRSLDIGDELNAALACAPRAWPHGLNGAGTISGAIQEMLTKHPHKK